MANILVTGGAGFIGSHTVVELDAAGHRPVIVDDLSNSEAFVIERLEQITGKRIAFYQQDYTDTFALKSIINQEQIDGIIHFAAFKKVGESVSEPLKYYRNNVAGFVGLLELLQESRVKNIVFSSSCTVYGSPDVLPMTEDLPIKPAPSPYATTKQMCEMILRDSTRVSSNLSALSLRYFNPIGAHHSALIGELPKGVPANLVPFITQTAAGLREQLTIFGDDYDTTDGTCIRDYIHVVDLAKAHVSALGFLASKPPATFDVFNIGTGTGSSVYEVLFTFQKATGVQVPYIVGPRREGDVPAYYASVDKAQQVLGWRAEKSLQDALADAWRWQQSLGSHL